MLQGTLKIYAGAMPADLNAPAPGEPLAVGELPGEVYGETMTISLTMLALAPNGPRYLRIEDAEGVAHAQCPVVGDIEASITLWMHAD